MRDVQYWKQRLRLTSHIEGGAFNEIYRAELVLPLNALTMAHNGDRTAMTSIYFLLEAGDFSAFHRIASDELWHFYDGDGAVIYEIKPGGELVRHLLGIDIERGASLQVLIQAGSWFASRVEVTDGFTLCGCTVSPGFDFEDFELADKHQLTREYPQHAGLIAELTR